MLFEEELFVEEARRRSSVLVTGLECRPTLRHWSIMLTQHYILVPATKLLCLIVVSQKPAENIDRAFQRYEEQGRMNGRPPGENINVIAHVKDIEAWRQLGVGLGSEIYNERNQMWIVTASISADRFREISNLPFVSHLKMARAVGPL